MCLRACNRMSPMSNRHHALPWCEECRDEDAWHFFDDVQLQKDQLKHEALDGIKPATDEEWFRWLDQQTPVVGREFTLYPRYTVRRIPNDRPLPGARTYDDSSHEPVQAEGRNVVG